MSIHQEFRFSSADGTAQLFGRTWTPDSGTPKAVIQLVHGISEHCGRYDHMARMFADHGFVVAAEDHLGHGYTAATPDDLGYTADEDGWEKMTDNVYQLHQRMKEQYPTLPYVIIGHSMGSFLTRSYLIRYPSTVDACVLMGTGQQPEPVLAGGLAACRAERIRLGKRGRSQLLQNLCFGSYNRVFQPNRTSSDWVCSVDEVVDRYLADPFCQAIPTVTLMRDMLGGIRFNQKKENLVKMDKSTPVLFLSGAQDPVGNMGKGVRQAYLSFLHTGCKDVSIKLYPRGRHEMHNEANRDEVYAKLLSWINTKLKL